MRKLVKRKLELNKVTICKLDNYEMTLALAGYCPPVSEDDKMSCAELRDCASIITSITKGESTEGC